MSANLSPYIISADDPKFKAAQELSEHLEFIVSNPHYPQFLEYLLNKFLHFIQVSKFIMLIG